MQPCPPHQAQPQATMRVKAGSKSRSGKPTKIKKKATPTPPLEADDTPSEASSLAGSEKSCIPALKTKVRNACPATRHHRVAHPLLSPHTTSNHMHKHKSCSSHTESRASPRFHGRKIARELTCVSSHEKQEDCSHRSPLKNMCTTDKVASTNSTHCTDCAHVVCSQNTTFKADRCRIFNTLQK